MEVALSQDMATFLYKLNKGRKRKIIRNILLLLPGIAADFVIHSSLLKNEYLIRLFTKLDLTYLIVISIIIFNSLLTAFLEVYSKSEKSRFHPLKGVVQGIQVVVYFVVDNKNSVIGADFSELFKLLGTPHLADGIMGIREKHCRVF